MAARWSEAEWDALFTAFPLSRGRTPDLGACEDLGDQLGRTPNGVQWMWQDANAYLHGKRSFASKRLIDYLARRGYRVSP